MPLDDETILKLITQQSETLRLLQQQIQQNQECNGNTQNIPWPKPLEVEKGDIYQNFLFFEELERLLFSIRN